MRAPYSCTIGGFLLWTVEIAYHLLLSSPSSAQFSYTGPLIFIYGQMLQREKAFLELPFFLDPGASIEYSDGINMGNKYYSSIESLLFLTRF